MKTFGRFAATIIIMLVFLFAGLYLVLNNLGLMLTEDHAGLKCRWVPAGVEITSAGRVECLQFKSPVSFCFDTGKWQMKSSHIIVTVYTIPRFRLTWTKISSLKNTANKPSI